MEHSTCNRWSLRESNLRRGHTLRRMKIVLKEQILAFYNTQFGESMAVLKQDENGEMYGEFHGEGTSDKCEGEVLERELFKIARTIKALEIFAGKCFMLFLMA